MADGGGAATVEDGCAPPSSPAPGQRAWSTGVSARRSPRALAEALDGPEAARRRIDWELEIESLGRRETELHRTQLRVVREQAASFVRDLKAVQEEVLTLRARQDTFHEDYAAAAELRSRELKDALEAERCTREAASSAFDRRLLGVEMELPELRSGLGNIGKQARDAESGFSAQLHELKEGLAVEAAERAAIAGGLERRCDELKVLLSSQAEEQAEFRRALEEQRTTLEQERCSWDQRHGSLGAGVKRLKEQHAQLEDLTRQARADLHFSSSAQSLQEASLNERVDQLSNTLSESIARLDPLHERLSACESHGSASLKERVDKLSDMLSESIGRLDPLHERLSACEIHGGASLKERVDQLSNTLSESIGRLDPLHERLSACEIHGSASLRERVDQLSGMLSESTGRLDPLHERLSACEDHGSALSRLEAALGSLGERCEESAAEKHQTLWKELEDLKGVVDSQHAALKERFEWLQTAIDSTTGAQQCELAALRDAEIKHAKEFEHAKASLETLRLSLSRHAESLEREAERKQELAGVKAELEQTRLHFARYEAHGNELRELKTATATMHTTVLDRLHSLEEKAECAAREYSCEAAASRGKLEQLDSRLTSCEALAQSELARERATLAERLEGLQGLQRDLAARHVLSLQELESLRSAHSKLDGEAKLRDLRHNAETERLDRLEHFATENESLPTLLCSLKGRMESLEKVHSVSADKQAKDAEALWAAYTQQAKASEDAHKESLRGALAQLAHETAAREAHGAGLADRMAALDEAASNKNEALLRRLEELGLMLKAQADELSTLKTAHGNLADAKATLDSQHTSLQERVDLVDTTLNEIARRSAADVEALRAAQSSCEQASARLATLEARHAEAADSHARDLQALQDAHATASTEMKTQHGMVEQDILSRLERLQRDAAGSHEAHARAQEALQIEHAKLADAHAKAQEAWEVEHAKLAEGHAKVQEASQTEHARLADEVRLVGAHAGSLAERLDRMAAEDEAVTAREEQFRGQLEKLERAVGEVSERLARDVEVANQDILSRLELVQQDAAESREANAKAQEASQIERAKLADVLSRLECAQRDAAESREAHAQAQEAQEALQIEHARLADEVKLVNAHAGSLAERLDRMASEDKAAAAREEQFRGQLEKLERVVGEVSERLTKDVEVVTQAYSKHAEELEALHTGLHDTADQHRREFMSADCKMERLKGLLTSERAEREAALLDAAAAQGQQLQATRAALEKLQETATDESGAREAQKQRLAELQASLEQTQSTLERTQASLEQTQARITDEGAAREAALKALVEEMHGCVASERAAREAAFHDTYEKHGQNLAATLHDTLEKHSQEIANAHARLQGCLAAERTAREAALRDTANEHAQELGAMRVSIELLRESLAGERAARETGLRDAAGTHSHELMAVLASIEKLQGSLANECAAREAAMANLADRHSHGVDHVHEVTMVRLRADKLEGALADERLAREAALRDLVDKQAKELALAFARLDKLEGSAVSERAVREAELRDLADRHKQELTAAQTNHSRLLGALADERAAREAAFRDASDMHAQRWSGVLASMEKLRGGLTEERTAREVALRDLDDRHAAELAAVRMNVAKLQGCIADERTAREVALRDAAEGQGRELSAVSTVLSELRGRLADERGAREAAHRDAADNLARELVALRAQHGTLQRRLVQVDEAVLGRTAADPLSEDAYARQLCPRPVGSTVVTIRGPASVVDRLDTLQSHLGKLDERCELERRSMGEMQAVLNRIREAWHGDTEGFWASGGAALASR